MHLLVLSVKFPHETYFDVLWTTASKVSWHRSLIAPSSFNVLIPVCFQASSIVGD
jgi:hypothetical protein